MRRIDRRGRVRHGAEEGESHCRRGGVGQVVPDIKLDGGQQIAGQRRVASASKRRDRPQGSQSPRGQAPHQAQAQQDEREQGHRRHGRPGGGWPDPRGSQAQQQDCGQHGRGRESRCAQPEHQQGPPAHLAQEEADSFDVGHGLGKYSPQVAFSLGSQAVRRSDSQHDANYAAIILAPDHSTRRGSGSWVQRRFREEYCRGCRERPGRRCADSVELRRKRRLWRHARCQRSCGRWRDPWHGRWDDRGCRLIA